MLIIIGVAAIFLGAYVLLLGLCKASGNADDLAEEMYEAHVAEHGARGYSAKDITAIENADGRYVESSVALVDEAYDRGDLELLDAMASADDDVYTWSPADQLLFERHASDTRRPFDQETE